MNQSIQILIILFIFANWACSPKQSAESTENTVLADTVQLNITDYWDALKHNYQDTSKYSLKILKEDKEKGVLTYENQLVAGQMLGFVVLYHSKTPTVLHLENELIGGTRTTLFKKYEFEGKNYKETDLKTLTAMLDQTVQKESEIWKAEAKSKDFEAWWAIEPLTETPKPVTLKVIMGAFWSKNEERVDRSTSLGQLVYQNGNLIFEKGK